jgi:hypothetical protein
MGDHPGRRFVRHGEDAMPVGMMKLSTATPEWLEQFRDDPEGLEDFVKKVVDAVEISPGYPKPELLDLYFEIGQERAYALIKDLDDYLAVKAVARVLGAESFLKLITTAQAVEAIERANRIREDLDSPSV